MIQKPVLGIIPARGGSKGIPGKNIRLLAGRPLIEYTVRAANASGVIDRLILSTDSLEIAEIGRSLGVEVPFIRPGELAQDDTPMLPVLLHAVDYIEKSGWYAATIVLLQPTAPLRKPEHIVQALDLLEHNKCDSVVSVVRVPDHYAPHFVMKIENNRLTFFLKEGLTIKRRQDVVPAYSRDGTVYVFRRDVLINQHTIYGKECCPFIIPSVESVNLDTLEDWKMAEQALLNCT